MNSATTGSVAVGSRRPQAGVALIAALAFGCLVAAAAYADRTGALTPGSAALSQSAAARSQLASAVASTPHRAAHSGRLLAWKAPHVPKVHPPAALPPRVVTISAPAPAPAAAAVAPAAQPAPAAAPATHTGDDSGGGDD
jgi:hypothetical protein